MSDLRSISTNQATKRFPSVQTFTLLKDGKIAAAADYITTDGYVSGEFHLPATFDGTAITFESAPVENGEAGTFVALYDTKNNAISQTVTTATARAYVINPKLLAGQALKILSDTNQADTDTIIKVVLKS